MRLLTANAVHFHASTVTHPIKTGIILLQTHQLLDATTRTRLQFESNDLLPFSVSAERLGRRSAFELDFWLFALIRCANDYGRVKFMQNTLFVELDLKIWNLNETALFTTTKDSQFTQILAKRPRVRLFRKAGNKRVKVQRWNAALSRKQCFQNTQHLLFETQNSKQIIWKF